MEFLQEEVVKALNERKVMLKKIQGALGEEQSDEYQEVELEDVLQGIFVHMYQMQCFILPTQ